MELESGWWVAVGSVGERVKMLMASDVEPHAPFGGELAVTVDLTMIEAFEIEDVLHRARTGHPLPDGCDHG